MSHSVGLGNVLRIGAVASGLLAAGSAQAAVKLSDMWLDRITAGAADLSYMAQPMARDWMSDVLALADRGGVSSASTTTTTTVSVPATSTVSVSTSSNQMTPGGSITTVITFSPSTWIGPGISSFPSPSSRGGL